MSALWLVLMIAASALLFVALSKVGPAVRAGRTARAVSAKGQAAEAAHDYGLAARYYSLASIEFRRSSAAWSAITPWSSAAAVVYVLAVLVAS